MAPGLTPLTQSWFPQSADWRPSSLSQHLSPGQGGHSKLLIGCLLGELCSLLLPLPINRKVSFLPSFCVLMACQDHSPKKILACLFNEGKWVSGLGGAERRWFRGSRVGGRGRCWPKLKEVKISEKSPFAPKKTHHRSHFGLVTPTAPQSGGGAVEAAIL